jgi:deoxyribodipyrimidine photo-lyase
MQRDQRVDDNWALLYAQEMAVARGVPLLVVFNLVPVFGMTTLRHYDFMFRGLAEVESQLRALGIPFLFTRGEPTETIPALVTQHAIGDIVVDQNPLPFTRKWRRAVADRVAVRLSEVDAHNIVPVWDASPKEEFAAYTFRPKVTAKLAQYLTSFPPVQPAKVRYPLPQPTDWDALLTHVVTDRTVLPLTWCQPGAVAAKEALARFVAGRLSQYAEARNDPTTDGQSDLSPYLHFGQLSAQRVAREVNDAIDVPMADREAFLEELIVRRELADNYCFYSPHPDSLKGAHPWAQATIAAHAGDHRPYCYTQSELDQAATHDPLWNAMQNQLRDHGKLHGWCRMYWAKKILEWSTDAEAAIRRALYLNDRYSIDGTDPNGIVGVMWSIAGVHDRAWTERPIFGKIRYMNFAGAKRKFDVKAYIARWQRAEPAKTMFT